MAGFHQPARSLGRARARPKLKQCTAGVSKKGCQSNVYVLHPSFLNHFQQCKAYAPRKTAPLAQKHARARAHPLLESDAQRRYLASGFLCRNR